MHVSMRTRLTHCQERTPNYLLVPARHAVAHPTQGVRSSGYQVPGPAMFDYGTTCVGPDGKQQPCNQRAYGSTKPPVYNLSAITTPLALFTGEWGWCSFFGLPYMKLWSYHCADTIVEVGVAVVHVS